MGSFDKEESSLISVISFNSPTIVDEIDRACSTTGGFVLTHHELPSKLLDSILETGDRFFNLPIDVKENYNLQKHGSRYHGYMSFDGEDPTHGTIVDCKESLYIDENLSEDHLIQAASLSTREGSDYVDEEMQEMRILFQEYHNLMKDLGNQMMDYLSLALGLERSYLQKYVTEYDPVILPRILRYSPQPQESIDESYWGHEDHFNVGLWSMMLTDQPGLEFRNESTGHWIPVPFVKHGIIMNVGNLLDRLTAGRYICPSHRTRNLSFKNHRLSLQFSYDPARDARLVTLPLPAAESVCIHAPVPWKNPEITDDFEGSASFCEMLVNDSMDDTANLTSGACWDSNRYSLVAQRHYAAITYQVLQEVQDFYEDNPQIKESHGWSHGQAVYNHACQAVACHRPPLCSHTAMEICLAALLHDVDDQKYFPAHEDDENAREILNRIQLSPNSIDSILYMISLVSCSKNGNHVPPEISKTGDYHLLIPRWSDRLEAVGKVGVVRCYQYNQEKQQPLSSPRSPRAQSIEELWELATPERFEAYQETGHSDDMISHYYDKLFHIACPPKNIVRNKYLERMAEKSSRELVEVCLRYGKTALVDEEYICELAAQLENEAS